MWNQFSAEVSELQIYILYTDQVWEDMLAAGGSDSVLRRVGMAEEYFCDRDSSRVFCL